MGEGSALFTLIKCLCDKNFYRILLNLKQFKQKVISTFKNYVIKKFVLNSNFLDLKIFWTKTLDMAKQIKNN